jgi:hypothetical protein
MEAELPRGLQILKAGKNPGPLPAGRGGETESANATDPLSEHGVLWLRSWRARARANVSENPAGWMPPRALFIEWENLARACVKGDKTPSRAGLR